MRTIIHDLNEIKFSVDDKILSSVNCKNNCIGCFSCWIKHPKKCALKDEYSNIVESIKDSKELILISKCRYGCYSNEVKRVLERCIGYVLPYFTIRNNEIHHKSRYKKQINMRVYFYGNNISDEEKEIAKELVNGNGINFNTKASETIFVKDILEIGGTL